MNIPVKFYLGAASIGFFCIFAPMKSKGQMDDLNKLRVAVVRLQPRDSVSGFYL